MLVPPGWDMRYIECFGFTLEDIGAEGAASLDTELRSAGLPLEELPGPPVFPVPGTPRERAERGHKMVRAGFLGEKTGPPSTEREDMALLFEVVAAGLDGHAASEPGTIQWDFPDAEPWHIVVGNGATRAVAGRAERPRATLQTSYEDFVDMIAGRRDPRRLLLRGRLRPRGDLRWPIGSRRMFPA